MCVEFLFEIRAIVHELPILNAIVEKIQSSD